MFFDSQIAFQTIRSLCIDLLQDRRFPLAERILMVGLALKPLAEGKADMSRWPIQAWTLPESAEAAGLLAEADQDKALPLFLTNAVTVLFSPRSRVSSSASPDAPSLQLITAAKR